MITSDRGRTLASGRRAPRLQLVSASNFVLATRDTGYKSTAQAVAEFIDNSLQAGARSVAVEAVAGEDDRYPVELTVTDDGVGMDAATLASALTFGGSSRFGDRSSLGRYGMGLPNGALSRARRVEVFTWQGTRVLASCLDVDEIVLKSQRTLSPIETVRRPAFLPRTPHGTTVRLRRCDRLEYRRVSTIVSKLKEDLGRIYRRFLQGGLDLRVNGQIVVAVDPLFLQQSGRHSGARRFGDDLVYSLPSANGGGKVEVRFSELPVERWHSLSSEEKRGLGVANAPCVSVVRAGREIDRGWFFMGSKRRENYDDWWRCEISFEPSLDELFGLTHAKQTISPTDELERVLAPDLEPIARALNNRVRQRFEVLKVTTPISAAERQAARAEGTLPALPRRREIIPQELQRLLADRTIGSDGQEKPYQIVVTNLATTAAFDILVRRGQLVLLLNARHPLYRDLYGPLAASDSEKDQGVAKQVALALLAAARAEATTRRTGRSEVRRFRQAWADVVATFFNA